MKFRRLFQFFATTCNNDSQEQGKPFKKGEANSIMKNGEELLKERISLFNGKTNPIRCFSLDQINSMNLEPLTRLVIFDDNAYEGVWADKPVVVKGSHVFVKESQVCREIAVATQMATHNNVHKLLGCCLDAEYPLLVYEWECMKGTLQHRLFEYEFRNTDPLVWKDRLRIAWEISHAVSYLHTAFRRPIIHRDLKPSNVLLDVDNAARLTAFGLCISIPEGEEYVEDDVVGTYNYAAPDYMMSGRVAESADVYSFGVLLLVLFTGRNPVPGDFHIVPWVKQGFTDSGLSEIVDPSLISNESVIDDCLKQQMTTFVLLALKCIEDEADNRPTMVDVAIQLKSIIMMSE